MVAEPANASERPTTDDRIALCLSGGGLRATLFHLGVVRALRQARVRPAKPSGHAAAAFDDHTMAPEPRPTALDAVAEVYAVSGGSILAAHMMANWDRYTGSDEDFAVMERAILDFADSNLRDRVVRRAATQRLWQLLPSLLAFATGASARESGRARWLDRLYRDLLGTATLAECAKRFGRLPRFHILTTSFRSAELCAFTNDGFEVEDRDGQPLPLRPCSIPLSAAVAASSAFPPLFPPITFSGKILYAPEDKRAQGTILLSDGGIFDNLGVEKYRCRRARDPKDVPRTLLISDGGAAFRNDDVASFTNVIGRNRRASDVLMDRVARSTKDDVDRIAEINDVVISIHPREVSRLSEGPPAAATQDDSKLYGMVRTDLDRFDPDLCLALVEWGERVGRKALADLHPMVERPAGPMLADEALMDDARRAMLRRAGRQSLWTALTSSRRDVRWAWGFRATLVTVALLLIGAPIGGIGALITDKLNAAKARADKAEARAAQTLANGQREAAALNARTVDHYSTAFSSVGEALSEGRTDVAKRIITQQSGFLFEQTVQGQELQARLDSPSTATPSPLPTAGTPTLVPGSVHFPQRVYIQFAGSYTRANIAALNARLKQAGWNVQSTSGERTDKAATVNQVRYGPAGRDAAIQLAASINADSVKPGRPLEPRPLDIVGPRNLEVWMSN